MIASRTSGRPSPTASHVQLDAIMPRLSRVQARVATSKVAAALIYLGALVFNLADSVLSVSIIQFALSTPWAVITGLGDSMCRGQYDLDTLQVFIHGERRGTDLGDGVPRATSGVPGAAGSGGRGKRLTLVALRGEAGRAAPLAAQS